MAPGGGTLSAADGAPHCHTGRSVRHELERIVDQGEAEEFVISHVCGIRRFQIDVYALAVRGFELHPGHDQVPMAMGRCARSALAYIS